MRIVSKSLLGAIAIHGICLTSTFIVGYVRTMNHEPDWEAAWGNVENLPSEVTFGNAPSPFIYVGVLLATVLASGILFSMHAKLPSNSLEERAS